MKLSTYRTARGRRRLFIQTRFFQWGPAMRGLWLPGVGVEWKPGPGQVRPSLHLRLWRWQRLIEIETARDRAKVFLMMLAELEERGRQATFRHIQACEQGKGAAAREYAASADWVSRPKDGRSWELTAKGREVLEGKFDAW